MISAMIGSYSDRHPAFLPWGHPTTRFICPRQIGPEGADPTTGRRWYETGWWGQRFSSGLSDFSGSVSNHWATRSTASLIVMKHDSYTSMGSPMGSAMLGSKTR